MTEAGMGRLLVTRIAIVDDREIWAKGAASLVRACGFQLAGIWSDPRAAMPELVSSPPDLLILAASLVREGHAGIAQLEKRPSIILVIEPGESPSRRELTEFPFEGLLIRDTPAESAQACLKSVAAGHAWLDPGVFRAILATSNQQRDWKCLSSREFEVANLASQGLSNKHIARTLFLSDGTVKMHMHHILAKLHMARRADLLGAPQLSPAKPTA